MKDHRTSQGAEGKCSLVQKICVLDVNHHSFEKKSGSIHLALEGLMAGWLADKMWVEIDLLKFSTS